MTGTGTQADPFIVDNWPDFVTAVGTYDAYVEFPDGGGVIDMNNVAPTGIPEITLACASIEGNDWIIQNLYCKGHKGFSTAYGKYVSIDKLHFLDFYFDDKGAYDSHGVMLFGNSDVVFQELPIVHCKVLMLSNVEMGYFGKATSGRNAD